MDNKKQNEPPTKSVTDSQDSPARAPEPEPRKEIGGRNGPDPTRYGDWEKAGRCVDF